jgi:hypothetical protein
MIAQQPSNAFPQPRADQVDNHAPISLKQVVASIQLALATRRVHPHRKHRAALTDEDKYWYTIVRGM